MASEFVKGIAIDAIPKRLGAGRPFNQAGADALLALVSVPGETGSDGILYTEKIKASTKAGAAKRLLEKVINPELIRTRTYADGKGWRWVIYLRPLETVAPAEPTKE